MNETYICIDLKSFYASVECIDRGLDPLNTNLVVADLSRTEKTICLAVTPSLKQFGVSSRPRLFEVISKVLEINSERKKLNNNRTFLRKSYNYNELINNNALELTYITAKPRMSRYIEVSSLIYEIYLKYIAKEDIHVYSIDEVFIDVTSYLKCYNNDPELLARTIIKDILAQTGITATVGIGTNMYLAKVAMDIVAKKMKPDENGVRVATLDEISYRKVLWCHEPLSDFWRIGPKLMLRLNKMGLYTMGDIALASEGYIKGSTEDDLYKEFGINAELIIDHAWGYENTSISDVKGYVPIHTSLSQGQVLDCAYAYDKALIIVKEMTELLSLDLVSKHLLTRQLSLMIGYDTSNIFNPNLYLEDSMIDKDYIGRKVPRGCHCSINLGKYTSSTKTLVEYITYLFKHIVDNRLTIRRINISANYLLKEEDYSPKINRINMTIFDDYEEIVKYEEKEESERIKELNLQKALLNIKNKHGKNAILKGLDLEDGAKTIERNKQIGGHSS